MLAQNQDMLQTIWTIFITWKFWLKMKTVFSKIDFSKTYFFKLLQVQKQDILNSFEA